jgi:dTDP-4-amino-4,6-dideoxygalactose transaminase
LYPYYRQTFGYRPEDFPRASAVFPRIVSLSLYLKRKDADVQHVIEAVRKTVRQYRR